MLQIGRDLGHQVDHAIVADPGKRLGPDAQTVPLVAELEHLGDPLDRDLAVPGPANLQDLAVVAVEKEREQAGVPQTADVAVVVPEVVVVVGPEPIHDPFGADRRDGRLATAPAIGRSRVTRRRAEQGVGQGRETCRRSATIWSTARKQPHHGSLSAREASTVGWCSSSPALTLDAFSTRARTRVE